MDIPSAVSTKKRKASSYSSFQSKASPSSSPSSASDPNWAAKFMWKPKASSLEHQLMTERSMETWDPTIDDRQRNARRRIKRIIFDDLDIDWKSIPAIEESQFKHSTLLHFEGLRCKSNRDHFGEIVKAHYKTPSGDGVVVVDGEEMVDMIG